MHTNEKLKKIREQMAVKGFSAYYVGTADPHGSEYISEHYKNRKWVTGFTGSAGYALITQENALLWADGRYFIQAEKQIEDSEFCLMRIATPGFPTLPKWLAENLPEGSKVAVDGQLVNCAFIEDLKKSLRGKLEIVATENLEAEFWEDRPTLPNAPIWIHDIEYSGKSASAKIADVRKLMEEDGAGAFLLSGLDDIAWVFNFRGDDVAFTPVALSFALLTKDRAVLYIDEAKVGEDELAYFSGQGVTVKPYAAVYEDVSKLKSYKIAINKAKTNWRLYETIPDNCEIITLTQDYTTILKTVLNPTELEGTKNSGLRDSVAYIRFIYWLKQNVGKVDLNELNVAEKQHEFRQEQDLFLGDSFAVISAYGPNAAMMHYAATPESYAKIKNEGFYLNDSGGQYYDGTTDITRTIAVGPLNAEQIRDYTLTIKAHIGLADTIFLEGAAGQSLDIRARHPLWRYHMDYKCGTGHSVGYVLGVHEGPIRFAKDGNQTILRENMLVTIEPGVYKEDRFGIRVENDYLVELDTEFENGDRFLKFQTVNYIPFEREALDVDLLTPEELRWINDYHENCYQLCRPQLPEEEREWLRAITLPL